jgi:hypothetical protein
MLVREQHGMNDADLFPQELRPQVRRSVDQQIALGQAEHDRTSRSLVLGMPALANLAGTANRRHAHACACPQQNHLTQKISSSKSYGHSENWVVLRQIPRNAARFANVTDTRSLRKAVGWLSPS